MLNPRPSQSPTSITQQAGLPQQGPLATLPLPTLHPSPLPHPFLSLYRNGLKRVGRASSQSPELLAHSGSNIELCTRDSYSSSGRDQGGAILAFLYRKAKPRLSLLVLLELSEARGQVEGSVGMSPEMSKALLLKPKPEQRLDKGLGSSRNCLLNLPFVFK